MELNKNISIWRGSNTPPTNYHLWIKADNSIYLHNGTTWDPIVDQDAFENLRDYLEHEQHSPKINLIDEIPDDSNLHKEEFKLSRIEGDLTITNPELFGRDQDFIAKDGDIYLQGRLEAEAEALVSETNPCLVVSGNNLNGKKVNIVFKQGDYELGVNSDGNVRTVHRQTEPTWVLEYYQTSQYYIKHIKTGKYLYYNSGTYTLSTSRNSFSFISRSSSIRSYEIQRNGSSQCINMQSGSGFNYNISEWTKGDTNNELFIIDPSTFALPKITSNNKEPYEYKINFAQNRSYYFGGNSSSTNVLVKSEDQSFNFTFTGTYNNLAILNNNLHLQISGGVLIQSQHNFVFQLRPYGYTSNQQFILIPQDTEDALNPFRGIALNNEIHTYDRTDLNNTVVFIPVKKDWIINRIISTQCATSTHDGLMSASDKAKLDQFQAASNYKTKQAAKSSPTSTATELTYQFIDSIRQTENGEIVATKTNVRSVSQSQSGLMSASDKIKLDKLSWSIIQDPLGGYEYVDLGLPSGTLWATKNVGAETETDTGLFYAWGDTVGYTPQEIRTNNRFGTGDLYIFGKTDYTKYNSSDQKTILDLEDDAAYVNMGTAWRMPTIEQIKELENNTTRTFENGVVILTSTINNKTLHFPLFVALATLPGSVQQYSYIGSNGQASFWSNERISIDKAQTMSFSKLFPNTYSEALQFNEHRFVSNNIRGVINLNN